MGSLKDAVFSELEFALLDDADRDVVETDEGLTVKGRLFAYRVPSGRLIVDLPVRRAGDLVGRGVGVEVGDSPYRAKGVWVSVSDALDWAELAGEAHEFVGEPAVGRQS
ncbi:hypothetical protein [Curtobacterium flaccumfaciens]|uniref:hypothetical protein n=1 Tax=Curtobacterium flaccumfaciens TaxID=2035 RepID=UPI003992D78C